LEPLAGYLQLARRLFGFDGRTFARAWNFGPNPTACDSVGEVVKTLARLWGERARFECACSPENAHEAISLRLDSSIARAELGWKPLWSLEEALTRTVAWYRAWASGADMFGSSLDQIVAYESAGPT
jgi:CDP-glucose 4,6-dehydratase